VWPTWDLRKKAIENRIFPKGLVGHHEKNSICIIDVLEGKEKA
jgi:hypothetical protein